MLPSHAGLFSYQVKSGSYLRLTSRNAKLRPQETTATTRAACAPRGLWQAACGSLTPQARAPQVSPYAGERCGGVCTQMGKWLQEGERSLRHVHNSLNTEQAQETGDLNPGSSQPQRILKRQGESKLRSVNSEFPARSVDTDTFASRTHKCPW